MRQFLAVAILGTTLAVTASSAFAESEREHGSNRVTQGGTTVTQPNTTQSAASSGARAGGFTLPHRTIEDHERP